MGVAQNGKFAFPGGGVCIDVVISPRANQRAADPIPRAETVCSVFFCSFFFPFFPSSRALILALLSYLFRLGKHRNQVLLLHLSLLLLLYCHLVSRCVR